MAQLIPIAEPKFTKKQQLMSPSFRFPPLREGNRAGVRFPLPAGGTLRRGLQLLFFVNFSLAIGIRRGVGAHGGAPCCAFPPQGGRWGLWSAEAQLPPDAEAALPHSEQVSVRPHTPLPLLGEKGWGEGGLPLASAQSDQPCQPRA